MSAATGLARQEDGFDKLLKLANLNAKDIAAAGEESRRQIQLTDVEQAKVKEAREYIKKHAALVADLQSRENDLVIGKSDHTKEKEDFAAHVKSENTRLETFSANLDARDRVTAETSKKAAQALQDAADIKVEYDRQHREAMASVTTASNTNIEIGKKLIAEEARLKEWENTLKAKAERIRKQAAEF